MVSSPIEYSGIERRQQQRRQSSDRRDLIRFELNKNDRRLGTDRRHQSDVWDGRTLF